MSIIFPYNEDASEKLQGILRFHKIRSTFYTENTLRNFFSKPKNRVATEDNNIAYETDCSNCEAVYFGESKQSSKNRVQMNIKDLSGIVIVIRMKL